jgi:hypothetical protein
MAVTKGKVIFWSALALVVIGGSVWAYNKFSGSSDADADKAKEDADKAKEGEAPTSGGNSRPKDTQPTGEVKQPPVVAKNKVFAKYGSMTIWLANLKYGKWQLGDAYKSTRKGEMIGTLIGRAVIGGATYVLFKDIIAGKSVLIGENFVTIK